MPRSSRAQRAERRCPDALTSNPQLAGGRCEALLGLALAGSVVEVAAGEWLHLLAVPIDIALWFWIAGGPWGRTTWGLSFRSPR